LFHSASFVILDNCIILVPCYVRILMCLFCLLCIAEFYVLLTVHPGMILVNNQHDAKFFLYVGCPKHVENRNKHTRKKLCVNLVIYKDHTRMHGQQYIKKHKKHLHVSATIGFATINLVYRRTTSLLLHNTRLVSGPGSSVGIATDYGLDGPGSNPGGDEILRPSRPALGPTQSPVKLVPSLPRG